MNAACPLIADAAHSIGATLSRQFDWAVINTLFKPIEIDGITATSTIPPML